MVDTFPSIKFGLMVGIGGGIPPKVRLGDVVVSSPVDQFPGVVQWDIGKAEEGGFKRTGALNNPPCALLAALARVETEHEMEGSKIREYLEDLKEKWPKLAPKYTRSDSLKDILFAPDNPHRSQSKMAIHVCNGLEDDPRICPIFLRLVGRCSDGARHRASDKPHGEYCG